MATTKASLNNYFLILARWFLFVELLAYLTIRRFCFLGG